MSEEKYNELVKSGIYAKESKMLLTLNDLYHEYIYLMSFNDLDKKRSEIRSNFR